MVARPTRPRAHPPDSAAARGACRARHEPCPNDRNRCGLSRSGSADASVKRDQVDATGGQSKAQEDAVAKPATTGESIVIPFGVLAIDDGDNATQRREDLTDTHGETQRNPPAIGRDLQVRVPMTSTKLADAPELDVTQLQRLAGLSFRHKVDSFYRATSTSERRGD